MKNSDIRTIKLGIWPADHVPLYPSSTVPQSSSAPVCWGASSQHLCLCTVRMPLRVPAPQLISMACACAERGREGGGDGSFLSSFPDPLQSSAFPPSATTRACGCGCGCAWGCCCCCLAVRCPWWSHSTRCRCVQSPSVRQHLPDRHDS